MKRHAMEPNHGSGKFHFNEHTPGLTSALPFFRGASPTCTSSAPCRREFVRSYRAAKTK